MGGGIEGLVTTDIREDGARAKVIDRRGTKTFVLADQQHFDSLEEAKVHAKAVRERAAGYGLNNISASSRSPCGEIQEIETVAPGMDAVFTAGHGGLKLTPERADEVDPAWSEPAGSYVQFPKSVVVSKGQRGNPCPAH